MIEGSSTPGLFFDTQVVARDLPFDTNFLVYKALSTVGLVRIEPLAGVPRSFPNDEERFKLRIHAENSEARETANRVMHAVGTGPRGLFHFPSFRHGDFLSLGEMQLPLPEGVVTEEERKRVEALSYTKQIGRDRIYLARELLERRLVPYRQGYDSAQFTRDAIERKTQLLGELNVPPLLADEYEQLVARVVSHFIEQPALEQGTQEAVALPDFLSTIDLGSFRNTPTYLLENYFDPRQPREIPDRVVKQTAPFTVADVTIPEHQQIIPFVAVADILRAEGVVSHEEVADVSARDWEYYDLIKKMMTRNVWYDSLNNAWEGNIVGVADILAHQDAVAMKPALRNRILARAHENNKFGLLFRKIRRPNADPISVDETVDVLRGVYGRSMNVVKDNQDIVEALLSLHE